MNNPSEQNARRTQPGAATGSAPRPTRQRRGAGKASTDPSATAGGSGADSGEAATANVPAEPRWPHVPMRWPEQEKYSEPWMVAWLEAAASSLSVVGACRAAGIGLAQFVIARHRDMAFDRAALIFDQIVDLIIEEQVRQGAINGDSQMAKLYIDKIRRPAFVPDFATWNTKPKPRVIVEEPLPPHVSEAMIAAGVEAMKHPPPPPSDDIDF